MEQTTGEQSEIILKPGMELIYTPTGKKIRIERVGTRSISWYVGFIYRQGSRKNDMRMTHQSIKRTIEGIRAGTYIII